MKPKLFMSIGVAAGSAFGTSIYHLLRYGANEIDWARALFVAVAAFTALALVPRRWLETPRK